MEVVNTFIATRVFFAVKQQRVHRGRLNSIQPGNNRVNIYNHMNIELLIAA